MLLTESEKAKLVRARILDIVISTINNRAGGGTKYINTRDVDFLPVAIEEDNYRKTFTSAIGKCVQGHKTFKYAQITDLIYQAVFKEKRKNTVHCYVLIRMTMCAGLSMSRFCVAYHLLRMV